MAPLVYLSARMNLHNRITTFALTCTPGSTLAIEAALLEVEATASKDPNSKNLIRAPGFTDVQCKELTVRIHSALASVDVAGVDRPNMELSFANRGLFGYSLSPVPGTAAALDLPIALAILGKAPDRLACAGELGLDGSIRPVRGILAFVHACRLSSEIRGVIVPRHNLREAVEAADGQISIYAAGHLREIVDSRHHLMPDETTPANLKLHRMTWDAPRTSVIDFADISESNRTAVAALASAVRANRDVLLVGLASMAHTMLARRIPSIMRPLPVTQQIMLTKIYSSIGLASGMMSERPFRAPHYTTSSAALVGPGTTEITSIAGVEQGNKMRVLAPRPGEVHLASYGVLLLDCVHEFPRGSLGALRGALDGMRGERPMIVATANTHGVESTDRTILAHTERALAILGITPDRVEIQAEALRELREQPHGRSSQEIRSEIWGMS